jgi:ubiquinone/menaquinone biosynthesis C-methylase UbiE
MNTETQHANNVVVTDNVGRIKQAFEQPQWYLGRRGFNIRIRAETIAEFVKDHRHESILDIGCGDGSLSLRLLNDQNYLTLLDQSQTMLRIASSRVPSKLSSRIQSVNASFMDAAFEDQLFDLVICVGVLAYVDRRQEFIAKIKALLKPGGRLILECTDGPHFISRVGRAYEAVRHAMRPARFQTVVASSATVLAICRALGLELSGSYRYSLPLPVLGKLMTQSCSYKVIRFVYGSASRNRVPWLGNECLFSFRYPMK